MADTPSFPTVEDALRALVPADLLERGRQLAEWLEVLKPLVGETLREAGRIGLEVDELQGRLAREAERLVGDAHARTSVVDGITHLVGVVSGWESAYNALHEMGLDPDWFLAEAKREAAS